MRVGSPRKGRLLSAAGTIGPMLQEAVSAVPVAQDVQQPWSRGQQKRKEALDRN